MNPRHPQSPFRYPHHHGNHPTRPPGHHFPIPHPQHTNQNYGLNPPHHHHHQNWHLHQQQGAPLHQHHHQQQQQQGVRHPPPPPHHHHHHHQQQQQQQQHHHHHHQNNPHHYPRQSHPSVHQYDHQPHHHHQHNPHRYPFNTHPPQRFHGNQHDPFHHPDPQNSDIAQPGNQGSNPVRCTLPPSRACPPSSTPFQGHHTPPSPLSGLHPPPPPPPPRLHPPPFQPPPHPVPPDPAGPVTLNPTDTILQESDSSRNPAEDLTSPLRLLDGQIATSSSSSDAAAVSMSEQSCGAGADHRAATAEALDTEEVQDNAESSSPLTTFTNAGDSCSQPASTGSKRTRRKKKKKKKTEKEKETEREKEKGEEEEEEMAELYKQKVLVEKAMQEEIMDKFPGLLNTTLFFPPQRFNKMSVKVDKGRDMLVHQASGSSDIGCDRAEEDVRRCLETIRDVTGEVMCVVFNYSFDNYLEKKHPQPARQARGGHPCRESSPAHAHSQSEVEETMVDSDLAISEGQPSQDTQRADCCSKRRRRRKISPASGTGKQTTAKELKPTPPSLGDLSRTHENEPAQDLHTDQASLRTSGNKPGRNPRAEEEEEVLSSTSKSETEPNSQDEQASPRTKDSKRQHDLQHGRASPKRFSSHRPNPFKKPESPNISNSQHKAKRKPAHSPDPPKPFLKAKSLFPNTDLLDKDLQRGDFDALIISQQHGCVIMETKSVGHNQTLDIDVLKKKAQQAIDQLAKQEKVLRYLFKDLKENLPVSKVLALPNVSRQQLRDLCLQDPQFAQALCSCCGVSSTEEALATALVADDLPLSPPSRPPHPSPSHPPHPSPPQPPQPCTPSHEALLCWWRHVTKGKHSGLGDDVSEEEELQKEGDVLGESVRLRMIARLAGPWSRVTIESTKKAAEARTVAECIHLTGLRYGRPMLREDQLYVLDSEDPFLFLTGPPGSGKTLVLGLKGLKWARQGDHVVVFVPQGVGWGGLVSLTLYNRIKEYATHTLTPTPHHHRSPSRRKGPSIHDNADNRTPSSEQTATPHSQITDEEEEEEKEEEDDEEASEESSPREIQGFSQVRSSNAPQQNCQQSSSPSDPPNIHIAKIEKMEDTEKFVKDLLTKYNDRPLRILVDEGPTKVNEKYIHGLLNDALKALEKSVVQVKGLQGGGGGGEGEEGVSCGSLELKEGRRRECVSPLSSASPESLNKVKGMLQKVQHHLQTVRERMPVLQPPHGRPPLTQTEEWKCFISGIRTSHASLTHFTHALHSQLSTLLTCHEKSESCGQFGADSSESSEDILNPEYTEGVPQNQGSVPDTSKLPRSVESAGNVSKPSENVASVCNASEDLTRDCRSVEDILNASKAMEVSNNPTAGDRLNSPESTTNAPNILCEDKVVKICHGDPVVCRPQSQECGEIHQKIEDRLQTDSQHSDTRQLNSSGQTEPHHSRLDAESGCLQTPQSGQASNDEAAGEKDALPDSSPQRNVTCPQNQENKQLVGRVVTEDTHKVPGSETPPCMETLQSLDVDEVLQVLDQLEAEMLEASGKLFNVENQMDFAVISDVLSLLVKEKGRGDLSVWSSAVTHFFQPPGYLLKSLPHCLRCPPTVQHVLSLVEKDLKDCPNYQYITDSLQNSKFPLPTNGPEVCLMNHASHVTKVKDILDCHECGQALADYLLDNLRVGQEGGVRVEDVAISGSLDINHLDSRPFLMALTHRGLQLQLQSQGHISPPPYPGRIFIIGGCSFQGLESEVVVFIPDVSRISQVNDLKEFRPELPAWLRGMGRWNRCHLWYVASRCLSQLVVFHV